MPRNANPATTLAILTTITAASTALAHGDDPKLLDRMPRYEGIGWRAAEAGPEAQTQQAELGFNAQGVTLRAWITLPEFGSFANANDIWGYTSPAGREYAILGLNAATAFIDISNPAAPQILAVEPGPDALWRDVKTYQNFAYSVSEGGGGIQVFDLANIDSGQITLANTITTGGTAATHNVAIDTTSGYLYRLGGGPNGLRIYDLNGPAGPASPQFVGQWTTKYVHDAQIVTYTEGPLAGRQLAYCCAGFNGGFGETGLTIVDVTNKAAPFVVGETQYSSPAYSHQGWLTDDGQFFLLNDELDEQNNGLPTTTRVIDVSDPENPFEAGSFTNGNAAIDHNCYVVGDRLFAANYRSGLRVFDISNLPQAEEIAFFDTFPGSDAPNFNGLWSVYPYFDSGIVIGSDIERGLFIWDIEEPPFDIELAQPAPQLISPDGQTIQANITATENAIINPDATAILYAVNGGSFQTLPLTPLDAGPTYTATLPSLPCEAVVDWFITTASTTGQNQTLPINAPSATFAAIVADEAPIIESDELETDTGWIVGAPGDNASSGVWTRVDPIGTAAQPENDNTPDGTLCYITGQGTQGGGLGENDVDNGSTTLISRTFSAIPPAQQTADAYLVYHRWYSNNTGAAPNADSMPISISNDNGNTWTPLENVTENAGTWVRKEFRIADFITPTETMRLRFVARDLAQGSLVEAGIDDLQVFFYLCAPESNLQADLNNDCTVDALDLGILLSDFGNSEPTITDINDDGTVDAIDLGILLGNFNNNCQP